MKQQLYAGLLLLTFTALLAGCKPSAAPVDGSQPAATWVEQGLEHDGATIDLGYRSAASGKSGELVPIAAISRDGQPVAGAMVFVRLVHVSKGKNETVGEEVATVFEEAAAGEKPLFVPANIQPPANKAPTLARFRIVLPSSEKDWQHDMPLP